MLKKTVSKTRIAVLVTLSAMTFNSMAAAPDVKVELDDQVTTDNDSDGNVDRGDTVTYQSDVDNTAGSDEAQNVMFEATLDTNTTLVAGSVKVTPVAVDDDYSTLGNVTYTASVADGLLNNDFDPKDANAPTNAGMTVTAEMVTTAQGGTATINADGSFSYSPALNFTGTDTFNYTAVDDDAMTGSGTVTMNVTGKVWFVDANAAAGGDGSQSMPFNSFAAINGAGGVGDSDEAGDVIYLFEGTYADALELEANQRLVGAGSELSAGSATIIPAGTAPSFSGSLTLAADNTIEGFDFAPSAGYSIVGSGASGGVLQNSTITLSATGGALDLDNHTGNFVYTGNITGSTSTNAVAVDGGTATITVDGDVTINGGRNIDVQNKTGGGLSVTGALSNNGGSAINLFNNSGSPAFEFEDVIVTSGVGTAVNLEDGSTASYSFNGDFDITTTNGSGLIANSGLLNLSDANTFNNVIDATNGAAVILNGGTTGVNVGTLTLDSLSSTNSGQRGVDLFNLAGAVEVLGGITVNNANSDGLRIARGTADITVLGDISVDGFGENALEIDADNTLGQLILGNVTARNSNGFGTDVGVYIRENIDSVTLGDVDVGSSSGNGIQVVSNTGSVTFNSVTVGTTANNIGGNGVQVSGNGTGNIDFGSGTIDKASGALFFVSGGSSDIQYSGDINQSENSGAFVVYYHDTGTVSFTGDLNATDGTGIQFLQADGTYNLEGTVTLDGTSEGIDINQGSANVRLDNATFSNITQKAIQVRDSGASLNFVAGSVSQTNGDNAIVITNNSGGTITLAPSFTLNTAAADAISMTGNASALTVDLSGALDIDTTSGKGIVASGGGNLSLSSASNTIDSVTGPLIELNGITIGSGGVNISSATSAGIIVADAINLTNVGGGMFALGGVNVAGTSGGGDGIEVNASTANTSFGSVTLDNVSGRGLYLNGPNGDVNVTAVDLDGITGNGIEIVGNTNAVNITSGSIGSMTPVVANAFDVNGGSGDVIMAAGITNSQNRAVEVTGRTGGTVNISSAISETGAGLNIDSNTGGTINLSGSSQVINTATNTALKITNNSGAVVNVTNGGLDIDATAGLAVNISGGGTVSVTGPGNTINAGMGGALNVASTTIGAGDLNFQSMSQNGGANAISLDDTGTVGSLVLTGIATTFGSGGTLANITTEAIRLTDTKDPVFNGLQISNITREAIKGLRVNGITVSNTTVDNAGSTEAAADDDTFGFVAETLGQNGLFGTARFENVIITNTHERAIDIVNEGGGSLDLDMVNVSVNDNDDTQGEDAIRVQSEGSINTDVLLSGGSFNNVESDVIAYFAQGTGTNNLIVTGVTSTNGGGPDNFPNGGGIAIIGSAGSTTTFDVNNNNLTGVQGEGVQVIGLAGASSTLTMSGSITGNTFSSDNADGLDLDFDGHISGTSTMNITIDVNNNTISFDDDGVGIDFRDAAGTGNFTIRNNTITAVNGDDGVITDSDDGIFIFTDDDTASGASHLNVAASNNTFSGIQAGNKTIVAEDVRDTGRSACFNLSGNSVGTIELDFDSTGAGGSVTQASVAAIASDNNGSTVNVVGDAPTFNSATCASVPLP